MFGQYHMFNCIRLVLERICPEKKCVVYNYTCSLRNKDLFSPEVRGAVRIFNLWVLNFFLVKIIKFFAKIAELIFRATIEAN